MRLAITGARGFVGRHVVAELARRGIPARLLQRPEFDLLEDPGDAFDRAGRPEVLLHLAWGGLPNYRSPRHFETERPAQYAFLQAMVRSGLRHLVVTGTCFEYGMQSGPLHEDLPCLPTNAYGHAKDALRRELAFLAGELPFRLTWARLFYLWGDGQAAGSLWPQLQAAAERGDTQFPMSGGEQLRDYLPVAQAASWLVDLALQPEGDGIVNLCAGRPVSVRALVEGWIAQQGWTITPQLGHHPYPAHEPMAFWGDNRRLLQRLAAS
ncbi:MAG: NAD(P)-dependent oxidoreductase [Rubrivivax sp.]|nr:NAD(P)-dependent oxidoreductase [Rubrivivax sp.]